MQQSKKKHQMETETISAMIVSKGQPQNDQKDRKPDNLKTKQIPDGNFKHIYIFDNDFNSPNSLNDKIRAIETGPFREVLKDGIDYLGIVIDACYQKHQEILIGTAYHEAGHAVAAYTLRRKFDSVSIIPDEASLGRVWMWPSGKDLKLAAIELAGFIAQYETLGVVGGHEGDLRCIDEVVASLTSNLEEAALLRTNIADFTLSLFESLGFWDAVEALAKALLEHGELDSFTARRIIKNAKRRARRKYSASVGFN